MLVVTTLDRRSFVESQLLQISDLSTSSAVQLAGSSAYGHSLHSLQLSQQTSKQRAINAPPETELPAHDQTLNCATIDNRFGSRARKCASPCSWSSPNTNAVTAQIKNDPATDNHLFYVTDRNSGLRFLVDTGAQVSVIPPSPADRQHRLDNLSLQAANKHSNHHIR